MSANKDDAIVTVNGDEFYVEKETKDSVTIIAKNEHGIMRTRLALWPEEFLNTIPIPHLPHTKNKIG